VYGWWCYSKVLLHVGLGRRPTVDLRVVIDKGQVQPLFLSELHDAFKQNDEISPFTFLKIFIDELARSYNFYSLIARNVQ